MTATLRWISTTHKRFDPQKHAFAYQIPMLLAEPKSLPKLSQEHLLFGYNTPSLFTIYDRHYLQISPQKIHTKLSMYAAELSQKYTVWMLSTPRFLSRGFNPITLYFWADTDDRIAHAMAEVTNTYGEKHLYFIHGDGSRYLDNTQDKTFHVSPFLTEKGQYHFRIGRQLSNIEIHIRYIENNRCQLYANMIQKEVHPMSNKTLLKTAIHLPLGILGTFPRILFQAAILNFIKKIPASGKPTPQHPHTIRPKPPSPIEGLAMRLVLSFFQKFEIGTLHIQLPDGQTQTVGTDSTFVATLIIHEYSFFTAMLFRGEIGVGESYVHGWWKSPDLVAVLTLLLRNRIRLKAKARGTWLFKALRRMTHALRANTVTNSKKNIQAHYDLSNDMYALFLDANMHYSSALFHTPTDTLEEAQNHKVDQLITDLHVDATQHVLEIGSGWGGAAIRLVKQTGCKVTTLTLSQAQYDTVYQKIHQEGLQNFIEVRLEDYRQHEGTYDRIVSIEMIEAVGHRYLPQYFKTLDRLLKPNGLIGIQAITIPDQRYADYLRRTDWIQQYIFPGGHLPSLAVIQEIIASQTRLIIEKTTNIGPHYATTLHKWRQRFLTHRQEVLALGFDDAFIRKWEYYFAYCETGFKNRYINTLQLIFTRPVNDALIQKDTERSPLYASV